MRKKIIIILSILILITIIISGALVFFMNENKETPPEKDNVSHSEAENPAAPPPLENPQIKGAYANENYEKKFYCTSNRDVTISKNNMEFYKDRIYFFEMGKNRIRCYKTEYLNELLENGKPYESIETLDAEDSHVCKRKGCTHDNSTCPECLSQYFPRSFFLLDPYESGGGEPIFYCVNSVDGQKPYYIERYDVANNKREPILAEKMPIMDLAVYDNYIMYISGVSVATRITVATKQGKRILSTEMEKGQLEFLGFDDEKSILYYTTQQGKVFALNIKAKTNNVVFQGIVPYRIQRSAMRTLRIHDGYLYYVSKLEETEVTKNSPFGVPQDYLVLYSTISRVPLENPLEPGEKVAENVFDDAVLGFFNNSLYYMCFESGKEYPESGGYRNLTSGNIYKTDLNTLKRTKVVEDCGFEILNCLYLSDDFCFGVMTGYRDPEAQFHYFKYHILDFKRKKAYAFEVKDPNFTQEELKAEDSPLSFT